MKNDSNSRFEKNLGTLEPQLEDITHRENYQVGNEKSRLIPSSYFSDVPLPYDNCSHSDDEQNYDDLRADFEQVLASDPIVETHYSQNALDEYCFHDAISINNNEIKQTATVEEIATSFGTKGAYADYIKTKEYRIALGAGRRYLRKKAAGKKAYFKVNQKFVLASLCVCVDLGITSIKIKADMKAGKTYAVGWLLANHPHINSVLMVTALSALSYSVVDSAKKKHGVDGCVYTDMKTSDKHVLVTSTFNSVHNVVDKRESHSFDLVLADESEQCAVYMANGTIDNKHQASVAMMKISKASKFIVLADAHIGRNTHLFASRYFGDRDFTQIFNSYNPWFGWTYSATGSYDAGVAELEIRLKEGKNVFAVFTSSELANQTARMLEQEGITTGIKTIVVCKASKKDSDVKNVLSEADNFKLYQICFVSPVAGAGISIETNKDTGESDHFYETIAFITRDPKTPNSKSALQILFRVRDLIGKHITIVCIDNPLIGDKLESFESIDGDTEMLIQMREFINKSAMNGDAEAIKINSSASKSQALYEADIKKSEIADYHKFWDNFFSELEKKGMKEVDLDEQICSIDTKEARIEARDAIKNEDKTAFITTEYVDDERLNKLIIKSRHSSDEMTNNESMQLRKRMTIDKLTPMSEIKNQPTIEQSMSAYENSDKGYSGNMDHIYCGQLSAIETKKLDKASIGGIGFFNDHLLDIFDNKPLVLMAERKLYSAMSKIIGLSCDKDGVFSISEKTINYSTCISEKGKRNQVNIMLECMPEFNATHDDKLSVMTLGSETLKYVVKLLKSKFGLKIKKVYKEESYAIESNQEIIKLINSKVDDDSNKYKRQLESIGKSIARESDRESFEQAKKDVKKLISAKKLGLKRIDAGLEDHIISHTMRVPADFRANVLSEYIDIAKNPRKTSKYYRPIALANLWLIDAADSYELAQK